MTLLAVFGDFCGWFVTNFSGQRKYEERRERGTGGVAGAVQPRHPRKKIARMVGTCSGVCKRSTCVSMLFKSATARYRDNVSHTTRTFHLSKITCGRRSFIVLLLIKVNY